MEQHACDQCDKTFDQLADLYTHKLEHNKPPTVVLVDHKHHQPEPSDVKIGSSSSDSEYSTDSEISTDIPPYRKRKAGDGDNDTVPFQIKKRKVNEPLPLLDYKKMYYKCIREGRRLKSTNEKFKRRIKHLEQTYKDLKQKADELKYKNMESEQEYRKNINDIKTDYEQQLKSLDSECESKMAQLNRQIRSLKNKQNANFTDLSKILYNCVTIKEIQQIRGLVETRQFDVLLKKHMVTLQNILLALSVGVIPVCNPQRTAINDEHKKLIENIQDATTTSAKKKIIEKSVEFTKLWSIIDDSLELICKTYNRYGSDEGTD